MLHIALVGHVMNWLPCENDVDSSDLNVRRNDPIALDQTCVDACLAAEPINNSLVTTQHDQNGIATTTLYGSNPNVGEATLDHGQKIGLEQAELKRI
ncbi:MAG: hypothetical protein ACLRMZ_25355 [Blautia marasmi]